MSINMTLALNIGTVVSSGVSTVLVAEHPLIALGLAFVAGVGVTISSQYSMSVEPFRQDHPSDE